MTSKSNYQAFEHLSDLDLAVLNRLLPWKCFTEDSLGRKLGHQAWEGKRSESQEIPDLRIIKLNEIISLANKSVLEVGCFEGVHTIGLLSFTPTVVALDSRIENVTKTLTRCSAYGVFPKTYVLDIDNEEQTTSLPEFDILHHVGVLYHLLDPVTHLNKLLPKIQTAVLLDTHYATEEMANQTNEAGYKYFEYKELGYDDVFSGMASTSKWLLKTHIFELLTKNGFSSLTVLSDKIERNGPRISLVASK
ncbi:DUF1698 domain-containing protein [Limnohabitans sp. Hippo4]|uniref:DUF1698 domain-containing protein n=1 Tax=Limnohabitans sp. Hippo4 TaxID=1826167 RepID=UPI000D33D5E0|nr:DUF1698 domain-containing protein [Limnohabitans sp. Hippo4]PUE35478.1 hypothetical protein B9Z46_10545 [Limnohabitans sp. Hippo4]